MKNGQAIRLNVKQMTYYSLKEMIVFNTLLPNEELSEEKLAQQLQVSRTPLREAIQRLEGERLLIRKRNGRVQVAPIDLSFVEEIFHLRLMLEGSIANKAALYATPEDFNLLDSLLNLLQQAYLAEDKQQFVTIGNQFHTQLARISKQEMTFNLLENIQSHSERFSRYVSAFGKWNEQAVKEHRVIVEHMENKDGQAAEQAMRNHIKSSMTIVLQKLKEDLDE